MPLLGARGAASSRGFGRFGGGVTFYGQFAAKEGWDSVPDAANYSHGYTTKENSMVLISGGTTRTLTAIGPGIMRVWMIGGGQTSIECSGAANGGGSGGGAATVVQVEVVPGAVYQFVAASSGGNSIFRINYEAIYHIKKATNIETSKAIFNVIVFSNAFANILFTYAYICFKKQKKIQSYIS